jgi:hypothetical protein
VRVEAADDHGLASIELWIDGVPRATSSTSPLEFLWDTTAEAEGEHHLVAKAHDGALNTSAVDVAVHVPSRLATYDPTLRVPRCAVVTHVCDSSALLDGRGTRGPEPNQPNTINSSCADGNAGGYHVDESNDRLRVFTLDGKAFQPGKTVRVEATVWAYSTFSADRLDLYYAGDASNPSWNRIATLAPQAAGRQVLSATYTLPAGSQQAVRARFRYQGSEAPCGADPYDDHDDLVFAVQENRAPVADPGGPYTGVRNQAIAFDGTRSSDPDGEPLTYLWNFGDGGTAGGPTPNHAYSTLGTFTVTLVVNDGVFASAPAATTATITNLAPSVVLTSPGSGALFTAPADVALAAEADDADGSIALVEFFADSTKVGEDATSPYGITWAGVPAGQHVLTARASDDSGTPTTSSPVPIVVNAPPSVTLTGPAPGAVFTAPATITLTATASDADGSVVQVEFLQGSTTLGVVTAAPYSFTWTDAPAGAYRLTAKATDDRGAVTVSEAVAVTVEARLAPVADAYVRDGWLHASRNFGSVSTLLVKKAPIKGSSLGNLWTYVKFDTSGVSQVTRARLRLFGSVSANTWTRVRTSAFPVADTSWGERQITWNNKPSPGTKPLATVAMDNRATPRWYEWDVTAYLQQQKEAGLHVVTLALQNEAGSSPYDVFRSREASANRPELVITP